MMHHRTSPSRLWPSGSETCSTGPAGTGAAVRSAVRMRAAAVARAWELDLL